MDGNPGPKGPAATPARLVALRQALGRRLRLGRQAAGVRQADLSLRTGYTRSSISHIESGRQRATLEFWQRAETFLGGSLGLLKAFYELAAAEASLQRAASDARRAEARRQLALLDSPGQLPADDAAALQQRNKPSEQPRTLDSAPAALSWLVAAPPANLASSGNGRRVGQLDVTKLQAGRARLKAMDDSLGGGAAYPVARDFVRREALPLLNGTFTDQTGRTLYDVLTQLTLDLGWMAYDAGRHQVARHHMLRALHFARAGQHRLLGGRVLAALSHQALHLGRLAEATELASAALLGTQRLAPPAARAMFLAMQACAAAAQGDRRMCESALAQAERALDQQTDIQDVPAWLDFDEGGLAGHAARAYRDLVAPVLARTWAEKAVAHCKTDHSRTRAQRGAILATVLVQTGELEHAASVATGVVSAARQLQSTHVIEDVADLVQRIDPSRSGASFRFVREARDLLAEQPPSRNLRR